MPPLYPPGATGPRSVSLASRPRFAAPRLGRFPDDPHDQGELMTDTVDRPLALVTGASTGIGYELAKVFAENGFDLIVAAENDEIRQAGEELRRAGAHVDT